jgi:hypothetical protein
MKRNRFKFFEHVEIGVYKTRIPQIKCSPSFHNGDIFLFDVTAMINSMPVHPSNAHNVLGTRARRCHSVPCLKQDVYKQRQAPICIWYQKKGRPSRYGSRRS